MSLRLEKILISGFIRKTVYCVRLQGGGSVVLKNCQKIVKLICQKLVKICWNPEGNPEVIKGE